MEYLAVSTDEFNQYFSDEEINTMISDGSLENTDYLFSSNINEKNYILGQIDQSNIDEIKCDCFNWLNQFLIYKNIHLTGRDFNKITWQVLSMHEGGNLNA